jgi:predicted ATPase
MIGHIVGRTDGNPLFVEELTKTLLEAETLATSAQDAASHRGGLETVIPTTLHDSLMARLDRLGRAKGIAQISATIGRDLSYSLLRIDRR